MDERGRTWKIHASRSSTCLRAHAWQTLIAIALVCGACANGGTTAGEAAPQGGTYESTRSLTGAELVHALGLKSLDVPRGEWLAPDDPRLGVCAAREGEAADAGTVSVDGEVYCLAGIALTELEEWELAQRIAGYVPCQVEIEAFQTSLLADERSRAGDDEAALDLFSEAHDLKLLAASTPGCGSADR